MYNKFKNIILDLLFPIYCVGCRTESTYCCQNCQIKIPRIHSLQTFTAGPLFAAAQFKEGSSLAKLIHRFKYDGAKEVGGELANLFCLSPEIISNNIVLIPVPLHKKRRRDRGYNQSEILAYEIGKTWNVAMADILQRHRNTPPQAKLPRAERLKNIVEAFSIKNPKIKLDPTRTYMLVDDVYTTGSTLKECAKVLRKNGAKSIAGLVIGRA